MTVIDELSKTLGVLQADIAHIKKSTDVTQIKVDDMHDKVTIAQRDIKSAHRRLDEIAPHVEEFKNLKQRGHGAVAVIAAVFGVIGAIVLKSIHLFFP